MGQNFDQAKRDNTFCPVPNILTGSVVQFVIKVGKFFLKVVMGNKIIFTSNTISGSYSNDFAYQMYPSLIVKKLKIGFSPKKGFF